MCLNILYYKDKWLIIVLLEYFDKSSRVFFSTFYCFTPPQVTGMINNESQKKRKEFTTRKFCVLGKLCRKFCKREGFSGSGEEGL